MPLRLTRRRIALFNAIVWVAAVHWFWKTAVPLLPTTSIPLKSNQRFAGILPNGMAAITHKLPGKEPDDWIDAGPVELWDISRAARVRELLAEDDRPYGFLMRQRLIPARRGDDMSLFNPDTGEPVFSMLAEGVKQIGVGFESDQVIGILKDGKLSIRDWFSGSELWSRSNVMGFEFAAPDLMEIFEYRKELESGIGVWRSTRTGEGHPELETIFSISAKGVHGSLVICDGRHQPDGTEETFVYDVAQRRRVWTMPIDGVYFFSEDGASVCRCGWDGRTIQVSRRDPQTGLLKSGPTADEKIQTFGMLYGNDRYALVGIDRGHDPVWRFSEWLRQRIPLHLRSSFRPFDSWAIHETASGKRLGSIQINGVYLQTEDPNWIVDTTPDAVHFYGFPPRRNWFWLIGWTLGPIVMLATIRFLANLRRLRRSGSSSTGQFSAIA